jgi:hypothetical protein
VQEISALLDRVRRQVNALALNDDLRTMLRQEPEWLTRAQLAVSEVAPDETPVANFERHVLRVLDLKASFEAFLVFDDFRDFPFAREVIGHRCRDRAIKQNADGYRC